MRQTGNARYNASTAASKARRIFVNRLAALAALATLTVLLVPSLATAEAPIVQSKPVNAAAPVLSGTPAVGATLSCSSGSWTSNPSTFAYAWLRDGAPIAGQVASTYTVQSADQGHSLSCQVTAVKQVGEYTISGLSTGSYKVKFSSEEGNLLTQYYSGKAALAEASPVSATAGGVTAGINAALQPAGQIAGSVTDASHTALANISVCASASVGGECARTNAAGQYTISGLPTGSYKVEFYAAKGFMNQFYNGKTSSGEADLVSVTAGSTTGAVDAEMHPGGQIAGTVTDAISHAALAKIEVCAEQSSFESSGCATTNASGEYAITGLTSGTYTVRFLTGESIFGASEGANYLTQYYNGKTSEGEAEPVTVTSPSTTPAINAEMHPGGQIAGKVLAASTHAGLANILVCAKEAVSGRVGGCAFTKAAGEYTISGLPSGSYTVVFFSGFQGFFGVSEGGNYLTQYYNNKSSAGEADPVSVTVGSAHTGIDAEMQPGGQIAGKVTDAATHAPLAKISVCATEAVSGFGFGFGCATTNAAGEYTISGLSSGSYKVQFSAFECETSGCTPPNYQSQFYNGKAASGEANPVSVTAPSTTSAINAEMHAGAQIRGIVTSASGGAPLAGIEVCAIPVAAGGSRGCATTNGGASSASATSNALTVPAPNSNFGLVKRPFFNSKTGEIDFFFQVPNAGMFAWNLSFRNSDVGFADALGLHLGSGEGAEASRRKAKRRCKAGFVKHGRRCVHAAVTFGSGSMSVAPGTVEVKVHASSKAIRALNTGHTLHVSGPFTFQSALGGAPVTHIESAVVHKPKKHGKKHRKHKRR